jgi:hypothetical protein
MRFLLALATLIRPALIQLSCGPAAIQEALVARSSDMQCYVIMCHDMQWFAMVCNEMQIANCFNITFGEKRIHFIAKYYNKQSSKNAKLKPQ